MPHPCMEQLEPRRLLSGGVGELLAGDGTEAPAAASAPPAAAAAPSPAPTPAATEVHVDPTAVRDSLIRFVDTWNGGQQGRFGTAGMGAYAGTWGGLFRTNLDRQFNRVVNTFTDDQTIVSQSRGIYINVEAHRHASPADQPRFRNAVQKGADYLLAKAVDPKTYDGKPGGMWWGLQPDGASPPTHTTQIGGTLPRHKDPYGHVQALLALAHAYSVTGDLDHLNGAFNVLDALNGQFGDAAGAAGAFLPTANENYTQRVGTRNLNYMLHAFEGLMALDNVTPAPDPRKAGVAAQVTAVGDFITTRMYRDSAGSTTMGYLPAYYDAEWNPSADPNRRYSDPGHDIQVAFLLSRAVENGFNPAWLNVADKLVAHTLAHGIDRVAGSPTYGAVVHEKLAFDGSRFHLAGNDLVWWQTAEAARSLLHFASVRGRTDLWDEYDAASAFNENHFVDPVYGGWFTYLDRATLAPTTTHKGTVWTGGYHEVMLDAERLRLAPPAPSTTTTLAAAADAYVRDGTYAGQNFGAAAELQVKKDAPGWTRESYLTFSLDGLGPAATAKLRLFGKLQSTIGTAIPVGVYGSPPGGWTEAGLTWNTRPTTGATALATQHLPDSSGRWYEWDVSAFVRERIARGETTVSLALRASQSGTAAIFNSDEAAANRPQLVVTSDATPPPPPQSLVVSTTSLSVPEGGSAQFTVKLAAPPEADVAVAVAREAGDGDVTVSGGPALVFTASNWNVPQPVTLAAAQDADSLNGSATIRLTSEGLAAKAVSAAEADDDVTATPVTLRAVADAYVRDGPYAAQNFGTAADLVVKRSANLGNTRESYLRFSLASVPTAGAAKLRLFGRSSTSAQNVGVALYAAPNVTWSEPALTWNGRPASGSTSLGSKTIAGTQGSWYEFDVTSYVRQQKALGAAAVTFVLKATGTTDAQALFASDEASGDRPELVVTP